MAQISSQIYLSRDQIRNQIIEYMKDYLELENVDLTKSSFLSFIIDTIATLTSNLLFYQTSVYREFFLTKAQLQESVLNLAAFLGYQPSIAQYSTANVLITIPFGFSDSIVTFAIPDGFKFKASEIEFTTYYNTNITVSNNSSVEITVDQDGRIFNLPVNIDTTVEMEFSFLLPTRQYKPVRQEFQLDADLELYQFSDIEIPFRGKISNIEVHVKEPGSNPDDTGRLYTQFNSLYLMSSSDYGFVYRRTNDGVTVYFGNGLIGVQPEAGSTIVIDIIETEGADGNVIASSINKGERIYARQGSPATTQLVNYTVSNPSPASGAVDEEDLEAIRQNAIASLTSLGRLVSENDYSNTNIIIEGSPIADNSVAILKRSDIKCNEIQLYTTLEFNNGIVPTRNTKYDTLTGTTYISRGTIITIDGISYYTLFDMTIEALNTVAYYHYVMNTVDIKPVLIQSFASNPYALSINNLEVKKVADTAVYKLSYYSTEGDYNSCTCEMVIIENETTYTMMNIPGTNGGYFTYTFNPYTHIPDGNLNYIFRISNTSGLISEYSAPLIFRQDLKEFMLSNTIEDGTTTIIYDIPVVQKEYYDGIVQKDFELQVLQTMLQSMDFVNYRMLTDFVNVKFCNTTGLLTNMLLNTVTKRPVIDIGLSSVPSGTIGDRYIVTGYEGNSWEGHEDEIALCIDSTAQTWNFLSPNADDTLIITNKNSKYIYTPKGWVVPNYDIPFTIEVEIMKDNNSYLTDSEISENVKSVLYSSFSNRFGPNMAIYRSEIIKIIQETEDVGYCKLIQPESNIFFNFKLDNFTQDELLEYTPDYVFFRKDDIICRIYSSED